MGESVTQKNTPHSSSHMHEAGEGGRSQKSFLPLSFLFLFLLPSFLLSHERGEERDLPCRKREKEKKEEEKMGKRILPNPDRRKGEMNNNDNAFSISRPRQGFIKIKMWP